ncbi:hypothetical protein NFX46_18860 [Streptomyces phaeoluteigriseus]|uniref:Uncharacterized protein n=1 Tax=Streptomyces phaeoluteigriseus TaxID=114686 RepID=A0ABY4Z9L7_9ACTN|nr:hypothetical protein [Streptomyces phaeoluteigriseus]USQ85641.1 hypothetical protein NFX46_18860 [Streptomyces phaeoluteigriseus]
MPQARSGAAGVAKGNDLLQHSRAPADGWTARDIDTALYWTGKNPQPTGH